MKLFIIAGEASGDLHGSNLIKELSRLEPNIEVNAWGGDLMRKEGAVIYKHYRDLAFMGFWEVAKNLNTIRKNFKLCKEQIRAYAPDAVIFIDYPGFNLRMAKWVKSKGIKTIYYISPQLWAWKAGRIKTIKEYVDKMITIIPFEKSWYKERGYEVDYVGHPLLEFTNTFKPNPLFIEENQLTSDPIIALLPGSRKQEIEKILPVFLEIAGDFKDYQFVIAGAPQLDEQYYQPFIRRTNVSLVTNQTYDLLSHATVACVTSGTATLETALFNVPQVVCYKGNFISYQIGKKVIKVKFYLTSQFNI